MSAYRRTGPKYKDKKMFLEALMKIYKKEHIEVHDVATNLYGYMGDKREEVANVIIRRRHVGGLSNDIGFILTKDGYELIISSYDSSAHPDAKMKLPLIYADMYVRRMNPYSYSVKNEPNKITVEVR